MCPPSSEVASLWLPLKGYIENHVKLVPDEQIYFDNYDADAPLTLSDIQQQIIDYTQKQTYTKLFHILFVIDACADNPTCIRHSSMSHSLYVRGRRHMTSTVSATDNINAINQIIWMAATEH